MDIQKAIEYFSGKLERTLNSRRRQAYESALEALERQIPKEVREICGALGETVECPECGSGLRDSDVFAGYCKWCGQKIKWGGNNMEELKKCPFCGGEAVIEECEYSEHHKEYLVYCDECSGMVEKWRNTKEEAIEQWNRRVEE